MNWRTIRWWLYGLCAYLFFLLATFPAAYAYSWLHKFTPGIQLTTIQGSVWSGMAREVAFKGQSWGALHWHFDWLAPFSGHLGYRLQLQTSETDLSGNVSGSPDKLLLQDVHGHFPISLLDSWLPLPSGSLSGNLEINLSHVQVMNLRPTQAEGVVSFSGVNLSWPQAMTLGDYQLKLDSKDKHGIHGSFMDTSGPLVLQGNLQLEDNGRYQVNGTMSSRDPTDKNLNQLLEFLPKNSTGHHIFSFNGQWR